MMSGLRKAESYINGEWVKGHAEKTFKVFNPSNGKEIGEVFDLDAEDTKLAVDAANEAFKGWSKLTGKERETYLMKWHSLILENLDELGKMVTEENGKPIVHGMFDVHYAASFVEWYAAEARRVYGETVNIQIPGRRSIVMKQPIGVAGLITPWNFPPSMLTRKACPALAAGCTVVLKTPEDTPYSPMALVELAHRAGIPKGVLNVVSCSRPNAAKIGALMCEDPKVAMISFTGSTEVGKILMSQCASQVKRVSMELGGLSPFIIFDSADIAKAVEGARFMKFLGSGQACISPQNFFIQEGVYEKAAEALTEMVKSVKVGNPMEQTTAVGPLINSRGIEKVERLVNDAIAKGATVLVGGTRATDLGELFFQPTILSDVTEDMDIVHQEVFGPVFTLRKFKTEEEVLSKANGTEKGLASYFYSTDMVQCFRMMEDLQAGTVACNDTMIGTCEVPFGGYKESGIGREGGKEGLEEFLETKTVIINLL